MEGTCSEYDTTFFFSLPCRTSLREKRKQVNIFIWVCMVLRYVKGGVTSLPDLLWGERQRLKMKGNAQRESMCHQQCNISALIALRLVLSNKDVCLEKIKVKCLNYFSDLFLRLIEVRTSQCKTSGSTGFSDGAASK